MHKQILECLCQYQGKLIGIFLIPLNFLHIFIPPIQLTTHTIECNMCLIYLLPLLYSHRCNGIFVTIILYLLPLINDIYNGRYQIEYGRTKFFAFHWSVKEFAGASLQFCNAWTASDLLTCPFNSSTYLYAHNPKTTTISCLLITYTLSLCPK
jgi:hypothetical protein